jgi:hypothetical protein
MHFDQFAKRKLSLEAFLRQPPPGAPQPAPAAAAPAAGPPAASNGRRPGSTAGGVAVAASE